MRLFSHPAVLCFLLVTPPIITAADSPPAAPTGITVVNLHKKQALPQDVFSELGKQGNLRFTSNGNLWEADALQTAIDFEFTSKPFWSAVREACGLWNLIPQPDYGNLRARQIMLRQANTDESWDSLPFCESEGFFIQAVSLEQNQQVKYGRANVIKNACTLVLMVYVDPALRVQSLNQSPKLIEAVDDAGHSMLPEGDTGRFYGGGQQRSLIYTCNVILKYPENPGKKIARLKCALNVQASLKTEMFTVDKPLEAKPVEKSIDGMTVSFKSMAKKGDTYSVELAVEQAGTDGKRDAWDVIQNGQLLDGQGKILPYTSGGGAGNTDGHHEYTLNYESAAVEHPEPAKWVLELPVQLKTMSIPIELKDLQLP